MTLRELAKIEKTIEAINMSILITQGKSRKLHKPALDEAIQAYVPLARELETPPEHIREVYQAYKKSAGQDHIPFGNL